MSDTGRENDPFAAFESDRTVIKPGAGRGAQPGAPGGVPQAARAAARRRAARRGPMPAAERKRRWRSTRSMSASLNPLVSAASPLLSAAPRIRAMVQHPNPPA